jgi:LytS/YehU family sensor histidine kinase
LIQPYVENAIVHGLRTKKGLCLLKVTIAIEKSHLQIVIEDNGIGRQASALLRAYKFSLHESKGTAITAKRIELINQYRSVEAKVEDLYDGDQPSGTRVIIRIAL